MSESNSVNAIVEEKKIIYVYHHPESKEHSGWLKIGDQTGYNSGRIKDQNEADNIKAETLYTAEAIDKEGRPFRDYEVHAIIDSTGRFEREPKKNSKTGKFSEWYKMTKNEAIAAIEARKNLTGFDPEILKKININITPRKEQFDAIDMTYSYWRNQEYDSREFLWNAKPRFGKTLTSYWFAEKIEAKKILIVTNRPAISDSWYTDYRQFIQPKGKYKFGSTKDNTNITKEGNLIGRALNVNETKAAIEKNEPIIFFISLQNIKGKDKDNPEDFKKKNQWIFNESWDLFIIDESHEATETAKAKNLFKNLQTSFTLHLSGTPFKALASKKFKDEQIFNWTYEDEQTAKDKWDPTDGENPYYELPRMNMFAYRLSSTLNSIVGDGEYAFDLNELFKVNQGKFIYEDKVLKFLDNLFGINTNNNQNKRPFPFADIEIRNELRHTFWLLPSVAAVRALKKLMQEQSRELTSRRVFGDYEIIDAAATGDDEHEGKNALDKVKKTIGEGADALEKRTITLSCGQLTVGITVKPWTAVLMLYGAEGGKTSATKYLQAAFRAQNPWRYSDEQGNDIIKKNCYVFDFAPDRLLLIFQDYAKSIIGHGEGTESKVRRLLNLLTVVAEDEYGEMRELNANEVVTMPLKLMTQEIVDGKFITSNKLFNIGNIFHLPAGAREILNSMGTIKKKRIDHDNKKNRIPDPELEYDENGNLILNESTLGKKKFEEILQENPDIKTNDLITIDDLSPSKTKTEIEKIAEKEQAEQENAIHDHLRYFSRAIPIILMAYGKHDTKLDNFEKYIDSETFLELVGITKQQFQDLRDKYKLFNEEVFNASIVEFMCRKAELADYYENDSGLDIFDYIPPQQTNQIYTPKNVVKMMIDNLEQYNPVLFKSSNTTFLDPYMKSGLFITEIVKRLYKNLENKIPDRNQRLAHILTKQVYGFAPSKILHLISNETIFGFMRGRSEYKKVFYYVEKNFVCFDDEERLVALNQDELRDKIKLQWGENMKFDAVVGNPPYQEETKDTSDRPIYNYFMSSSYKISDLVCLITPARFLFNAGKTPKAWNNIMLNDRHIRVMIFEKDSWKFFPNTNISGGVAVTIRDLSQELGPIGVFHRFDEVRTITEKVQTAKDYNSIKEIMFLQNKFNLQALYSDFPEFKKIVGSGGCERRLTSSIFSQLSVFKDKKINENDTAVLGLANTKRTLRYIAKKYLDESDSNLNYFKVAISAADGAAGLLGDDSPRITGSPTVLDKHTGITQTFLSFGKFTNQQEAVNCCKYIKTKFTRLMVGTLKATNGTKIEVWSKVPIQDFTNNSDIDWQRSIQEIDQQLYKKYMLNDDEIEFIESHIKPMS